MSDPAPPLRYAITFGASFLGFPTHLGFLRGLVQELGAPVAVAGSSSGALVAGLYAAGISLEQMEETFTQPGLKWKFHEPAFPWRALNMLLGRPGYPALLTGERLFQMLRHLVGDRRLEDCTVARLTIAATNLRTSQVELRQRGPLAATMIASCALPGFLAPRLVEGELLWDGGLGSVVPVEQWIDDPEITHVATHAILHEEQTRTRLRSERYTFAGAMLAGHQLAADELLRWKVELARRTGKQVTQQETITPRPRLGIPFSWRAPKPWPAHARDLIAAGEQTARAAAAALRARPGSPIAPV